MKQVENLDLFTQAKNIKASTARESIPKTCYKRSHTKTAFWYLLDMALFLFGMFLVFSNASIGLQVLGGLISGCATAMLFVWAHDAAHGALFKNSKVAEFFGTMAMLPSLNMYRMWVYGHNKVHHGFTSFSPIDWIWRPLTLQEYQALSGLQKLLYRVERCFFTCAFHYFRRIWWSNMVRYNPGKDKAEQRYYRNSKMMVLTYALLMAVVSYFCAGGIIGIISALIIPFIIFNYFIAMIVYLHHTHPDLPFMDLKKDWSHAVGAIYCSTIIHCSKISRLMLHNIYIHIPHHLDPRIPFYNLPKAYAALKLKYGEYFHEYTFKWSVVSNIFKQCKLYDYEKKIWMTFKDAKST